MQHKIIIENSTRRPTTRPFGYHTDTRSPTHIVSPTDALTQKHINLHSLTRTKYKQTQEWMEEQKQKTFSDTIINKQLQFFVNIG